MRPPHFVPVARWARHRAGAVAVVALVHEHARVRAPNVFKDRGALGNLSRSVNNGE
jgi:hypothetical protein